MSAGSIRMRALIAAHVPVLARQKPFRKRNAPKQIVSSKERLKIA
jgi:hypothetical protein